MVKDFNQNNLVKNHGILINISLHINKIHWEYQFELVFELRKEIIFSKKLQESIN